MSRSVFSLDSGSEEEKEEEEEEEEEEGEDLIEVCYLAESETKDFMLPEIRLSFPSFLQICWRF